MYVHRPLDETLVLKNSASMADRVFTNMRVQHRTITLLLLLKLYAVQKVYNRRLKYSSWSIGIVPQ